MFCRNCGKEVLPNTQICLSCGVRKFNGTKYCYNCGAQTIEIQEICIKCGSKLREETKNETIPHLGIFGLLAFVAIFFVLCFAVVWIFVYFSDRSGSSESSGKTISGDASSYPPYNVFDEDENDKTSISISVDKKYTDDEVIDLCKYLISKNREETTRKDHVDFRVFVLDKTYEEMGYRPIGPTLSNCYRLHVTLSIYDYNEKLYIEKNQNYHVFNTKINLTDEDIQLSREYSFLEDKLYFGDGNWKNNPSPKKYETMAAQQVAKSRNTTPRKVIDAWVKVECYYQNIANDNIIDVTPEQFLTKKELKEKEDEFNKTFPELK